MGKKYNTGFKEYDRMNERMDMINLVVRIGKYVLIAVVVIVALKLFGVI